MYLINFFDKQNILLGWILTTQSACPPPTGGGGGILKSWSETNIGSSGREGLLILRYESTDDCSGGEQLMWMRFE